MKIIRTICCVAVVLVVITMAAATFIENTMGTDAARQWVYGSWAFAMLWALIAATGTAIVLHKRLHRRPAAMLLHVALLVILAGAAVTWLTSEQDQIELEPGKPNTTALPFTLELQRLETVTYPGTTAPRDWVSHLLVDGKPATVSMNKVLDVQGYRLFQSGYSPDGQGTVLTVTHDPWGTGITYAGYVLLLLGGIGVMAGPWRRLLKALMVAVLAAGGLQATAAPTALPAPVAEQFGNVWVMHNNRMAPFETLARDFTIKLYGSDSYQGFTAVQVATGWMLFPLEWAQEPMIRVKSGKARELLGIEGRYASLVDARDFDGSYKLQGQPEVMADDEKFQIAVMMASGKLAKLFPVSHQGQLLWHAPMSDDLPQGMDEGQLAFITQGLNYLTDLVARNDQQGAIDFVAKLKRYQEKEAAGQLPTPAKFKAEQIMNRTDWSRPLAMLLAAMGVAFIVMAMRGMRRWAWLCCLAAGVAAATYLTLLLALRWWVGGHAPMSNGEETMMMLSWATLLIGLAAAWRHHAAMPASLLVAGLALLVATLSSGNPQLTQLMPVLHSPLLSIHVAVIMVAYSLLALLTVNAAMGLAQRGQRQRLALVGRIVLMPAVLLLAAGIFVGAVWANVSWGSYWNWDPKETWALITLLVYAAPLHGRWSARAFHTYCLLAFASVLFTYFGVNYLLSGMHSYA